jgi:uncharacterized protein (DUF488 family)
MTEEFRAGLDRLRYLGHQSPTAIMCAEAVWWQCHRRIISDYLMAADEIVFHIMGGGRHTAGIIGSSASGRSSESRLVRR